MALRLVVIGLLISACGEVTTDPVPDAAPLPSVAGIWQIESGTFFDFSFAGDPANVRFIEFTPSADGSRVGTGQIFASSERGVQDCANLGYAELGADGITISVGGLLAPEVRILEHVDGDHVAVIDAFGARTELERVDAVPEDALCNTALVASELPLPVATESFTGLANDGRSLWYEATDGTWIPFDPSSSSFGTAIPVPAQAGQFTHIQAFQSGEFWVHCGCGSNDTASRIDPATGATSDDFDTGALLGQTSGLNIGTVLFDGENVLAGGFNFDTQQFQLLTIDVEPEPDLLRSTLAIPFDARRLGLRDAELWAQTFAFGPVLVQLDPTDGAVLDSISLPPDVNIETFSFAGATLYALGRTNAGAPVMFELTLE